MTGPGYRALAWAVSAVSLLIPEDADDRLPGRAGWTGGPGLRCWEPTTWGWGSIPGLEDSPLHTLGQSWPWGGGEGSLICPQEPPHLSSGLDCFSNLNFRHLFF